MMQIGDDMSSRPSIFSMKGGAEINKIESVFTSKGNSPFQHVDSMLAKGKERYSQKNLGGYEMGLALGTEQDDFEDSFNNDGGEISSSNKKVVDDEIFTGRSVLYDD